MLKVADLESSYGEAEVLRGMSLEVPDGGLVALLGRNGMGKTSLCRSIMGLSPPQVRAGSIRYEDAELTRLQPHQVARLGIGYVPQGRHIFPSLDVVENLTMPAREGGDGGGWNLDRVWEMFPRLAERKRHGAGQLSGGEQQMVAIARALMTNPVLLVMDEPSEGLAPVVVEQLTDRLGDLKGSGLTMLLVEQNYAMATALADTVFVLENGRIAFEGGVEELDSAEDVKRKHLGVGV
jgi:branched-chain amino acid transport system ATP-binding protein